LFVGLLLIGTAHSLSHAHSRSDARGATSAAANAATSADRRAWLRAGSLAAAAAATTAAAAPAARAATLLPTTAARAPGAGRSFFPTILPPLFSRDTVRYEARRRCSFSCLPPADGDTHDMWAGGVKYVCVAFFPSSRAPCGPPGG